MQPELDASELVATKEDDLEWVTVKEESFLFNEAFVSLKLNDCDVDEEKPKELDTTEKIINKEKKERKAGEVTHKLVGLAMSSHQNLPTVYTTMDTRVDGGMYPSRFFIIISSRVEQKNSSTTTRSSLISARKRAPKERGQGTHTAQMERMPILISHQG